ncbi:flagellar biosynthesis anti-sigma factor FlgM [Ectobacillus polymachus]|uniref:flagellar biosynthesis anti-sigma factor FlgM n=1 Tax=Ectobacillus polymachus TaxID=1508806 RepID=UPI003A88030E
MKINNYSRIVAAYQPISKVNGQKKSDDTKKNEYDHLELSNEAKQQLRQDREAKIEMLKNKVANGTYQIDSEKIADKLLSSFENGGKVVE